MGDTTDGSSNAAQSAQSDTTQHLQRGFFDRIVEAFSPSDMSQTKASEANGHAVAPARPGLANLRRMRVEDVMIPKAEIVAVADTLDRDELVEIFRSSGLTRLPVYSGTLDTPIGFVNLKDFALRFGFNGQTPDFDLQALVRPLIFVPPSMPLGILLQKMQTGRTHMALVVDEYGGTDGLVTIEDLLEQVVGTIEDEHDTDEEQSWVKEADGSFLALAKTDLEEFEAEIGIDLTAHEEIDEEEVDTLGGLVFMLIGRVPVRGEVIPHPDGPEFEILDADPRRIKRMRVRLGQADGE